MDERAEGVGVTLEVGQVGPLLGGEVLSQRHAGSLAEICPDGFLARVAEGRVAQVVCQACRGHDFGDVTQAVGPGLGGIFFSQAQRHLAGEAFPHARHLHGVGEPVVHKDASRQREHLCLVLQPSEG